MIMRLISEVIMTRDVVTNNLRYSRTINTVIVTRDIGQQNINRVIIMT